MLQLKYLSLAVPAVQLLRVCRKCCLGLAAPLQNQRLKAAASPARLAVPAQAGLKVFMFLMSRAEVSDQRALMSAIRRKLPVSTYHSVIPKSVHKVRALRVPLRSVHQSMIL